MPRRPPEDEPDVGFRVLASGLRLEDVSRPEEYRLALLALGQAPLAPQALTSENALDFAEVRGGWAARRDNLRRAFELRRKQTHTERKFALCALVEHLAEHAPALLAEMERTSPLGWFSHPEILRLYLAASEMLEVHRREDEWRERVELAMARDRGSAPVYLGTRAIRAALKERDDALAFSDARLSQACKRLRVPVRKGKRGRPAYAASSKVLDRIEVELRAPPRRSKRRSAKR